MVSATFLASRSARMPITEVVSVTDIATSPTTTTGIRAERRPVTEDSPFATVAIQTGQLEFVLHSNTMGGIEPRTQWTITDSDSVVYEIDRVDVRLANSRYHCLVTRQR